ncbi:MAG: TauD/TfdA family dioxygenase [Cyanobacteria bacterium P01_H01_bin.21]
MRPTMLAQIGFEIRDVDAVAITPDQVARVKQAVYDNKLVVLRNQSMTSEQYVAFANKLGTPQIYFQDNYHHPDHPEIFVSSNVLEDGKKVGVAGTGRYWHTDCAFQPEPLSWTMLYPQVLPQSVRETYYIDMCKVYQKLPDKLRRQVDGAFMVHEAKWRYKVQAWDVDRAIIDILNDFEKKAPPATHPAVITHPVTQKPSLYISEGFTTRVVGLEPEQSQQILSELLAFVQRDEHIYTHIWQDGDILLWDNRVLLHKAGRCPRGESSVSHRIGVYDGLPFYVA